VSEPYSTSSAANMGAGWPRDEDIVAGLPDVFYHPLAPEACDQGDPYVLDLPESANSDYRFYIYTSGEQPDAGMAIPCYGTNDLRDVRRLGSCLIDQTSRAHWAPCVSYLPFLAYPYVMLYSRSIALGEKAHLGHQIVRAHSKRPDGPFIESGDVLTPHDDFAIDPDVYTLADGTTKVAFATDFVNDEPIGTGIVEASVRKDLTRLVGERSVLARAKTELQIYEEARVMPWKRIPGIQWERGDVVKWYTVEAPVHLETPAGKRAMLYSTGAFYKENYAVGLLVEDDAGRLVDVTATRNHYVIRSQPASGIYALGHPSIVQLAGRDFLIIHMRMGSVEALRQMTIVPLLWTDGGLPFCPSLADLRDRA
jgi:arabinan endo-1,5-alpha-L-arabinosidase